MITLLLAACSGADTCQLDDTDTLGELTAWEEGWLEEEGLPPAPAPDYLVAEDGLALAYRDWWVDDPADIVLLVHGSSAHGELYGQLGQVLQDQGIAARLPDLRGHGLSVCDESTCGQGAAHTAEDDGRTWPGRPGDALDASQLARDLGRQVEALRSTWPQARLHLVGHSSGGGMISRYVELTGAPGITSVVLLAPYNHPDQPQVRPEVRIDCEGLTGTTYARLDLGALGDALRGNVHRYVLSLHKSEELTTDLDTLAYTWTMVQALSTTSPQGFWAAYDLPVLLVAAEEDHLLDPELSEEQVALAAQGSFALVEDTSHIGLIWSEEVGRRVASWVQD